MATWEVTLVANVLSISAQGLPVAAGVRGGSERPLPREVGTSMSIAGLPCP